MKTWKEYQLLAQTQLGISLENIRQPILDYKYIGLTPTGEKVEFLSAKEMVSAGYQTGRNAVRVCTNQAEVDVYWETVGKINNAASELFHTDLQREYSHLHKAVYDLCYNEAYERGHSSGYDEVANYMISVTAFAEAILNVKTK